MNKLETETIISLNDEDDYAEIYSCQSKIWTLMRRMGVDPVLVFKAHERRVISKTFQVPVKYILIRIPRKVTKKVRDLGRASAVSLNQRRVPPVPK